MDDAKLKEAVLDALRRIAPEVETDEIDPRRPLRDQVDLDSMDWLNFLLGLHATLGVDIPETDYAKLVSLEALLSYVRAKLS
jgi:acyl carrier protein